MSDPIESYPVPEGHMVVSTRQTLSQRLDLEVNRSAERNAKIQRLKELFEKHPDLKETLDLLVELNVIHVSVY